MRQNTLIKKEKNIADAFNDSHDDSGDPVTKGYFRGYMEALSWQQFVQLTNFIIEHRTNESN